MTDQIEQDINQLKDEQLRLADRVADVEAESDTYTGSINMIRGWIEGFNIKDWIFDGFGIFSEPRAGGTIQLEADAGGTDPYPFQVIDGTVSPTEGGIVTPSIRGGLFDVIRQGGLSYVSLQIENPLVNGDFTGAGSLPSEIATTSASLSNGETKWVYLVTAKSPDEEGNIAEADVLEAYLSTDAVRPTELNQGTEYQPESLRVLAKVFNDEGRIEITQEWTGGDIKEQAVVADATDEFNTTVGGDSTSRSIDFDASGRFSLFDIFGQLDGKVALVGNDGADNMTVEYDTLALQEQTQIAVS